MSILALVLLCTAAAALCAESQLGPGWLRFPLASLIALFGLVFSIAEFGSLSAVMCTLLSSSLAASVWSLLRHRLHLRWRNFGIGLAASSGGLICLLGT